MAAGNQQQQRPQQSEKDAYLEKMGLLNYQTKGMSAQQIADKFAAAGVRTQGSWFKQNYGQDKPDPVAQPQVQINYSQQQPTGGNDQGQGQTPPTLYSPDKMSQQQINYVPASNGLVVKERYQTAWLNGDPSQQQPTTDPNVPLFASVDQVKAGQAAWEDVAAEERKQLLLDPTFYKSGEITKYDPAIQQQILADPNFDWDKLPKWQKTFYEISSNPKIMASPMALAGANAGSFLGTPGKIIGAAAGYGLGLVGGQEYDPTKGVAEQQTVAGKLMRVLNVLSEFAEQGAGYAGQLSDAAIAGAQGNQQAAQAAKDMIFDPVTRTAAFEAGRLTYEYADFGGRAITNFMQMLSGEKEFAQSGEDFVLGVVGPVDKVKVKGTNPLTGEEQYYTDVMQVLLDTRKEIEAEIRAGGNPDEIVMRRLNEAAVFVGSQTQDLALQSIADPLEYLPKMTVNAGGKIADLTGNKVAAEAFKTSDAPIQAAQRYRTLVQSNLSTTIDPNFKLDQMGAFSRWVAGVNSKTEVRAGSLIPSDKGLLDPVTTERKKGLLGFIQNMAEQDPYSRAQTGANMFYENVSALLTRFEDVHEAIKYLKALANNDMDTWAGLGTRFADSPEFYTVLPALKDFNTGKLDAIVQQWDISLNNRDALTRISNVLGVEPGKWLEDTAKRGTFEQDFQRLKKAGEGNTPEARAIKADIEAGRITPDFLKQTVDLFTGEGALSWHPGQWKALVMDAMGTHFDEWVTKRMMLDKSPEAVSAFYRTTALMKQAQSILLLGGSPGYAITNGLSNMVNRAFTGIYGYMTPKQINGFLDRMGMTPARMDEGVGIGGQVEAKVGTSKVQTSAMDKARRGKGALTQAKDALAKISRGMPMSKLSSMFEKVEGQQGFAIAMKQFWSQSWRRGAGFSKMSPELVNTIKGMGISPERIYAAIEAGMNQKEIESALFGRFEGVQARSLIHDAAQKTGMSASQAADMLEKIGVLDTLDTYLKGQTTKEGIQAAFNRANRQAQDFVDMQTGDDLKAIAESVKQRVGIEGAAAALDVVQKAQATYTDAWLDHYFRFGEVMNDLSLLDDPAQRSRAIDFNYEVSDGEFRRVNARNAANYQGIFEAWGMRNNPEAMKVLASIGESDSAMANAYRTMREIRKGFFDKYRNDWDNPAKWDEWDASKAQIDRIFEKAFKDKAAAEKKMAASLGNIYESLHGPAAGEAARLWWQDVVDMNAEIVAREQEFRKTLADMTKEQRDAAKRAFYSETKIGMIVELDRLNAEGIARLERVIKRGNGGQGTVDGGPTKTPPPTQPEAGAVPGDIQPAEITDAARVQQVAKAEANQKQAQQNRVDEFNALMAAAEGRKAAETKETADRVNAVWEVAGEYWAKGGYYERGILGAGKDKFALLNGLRKPEYGGIPDLTGIEDPRLTPEIVRQILENRKAIKEAAGNNAASEVVSRQPSAGRPWDSSQIDENTSLLRAIALNGGIDIKTAKDLTGESRPKSAPGVFTRKGVNIDEMARMLADNGYPIDVNRPDDMGGVRQTTELISKARAGIAVYPVGHDFNADVAKAEAAYYDGFENVDALYPPADPALWQTEFETAVTQGDLTKIWGMIGDYPETFDPAALDGYIRMADETAARVEAEGRDLEVAQHMARAEEAIAVAETRAEAVTTRQMLKEKFADAFGLSETQAQAYMELSDAVIGHFAKITGESADALYSRYYKDVVKVDGDDGPQTVDNALKQESELPINGQEHTFRYLRNTEKSPNMGARFGQDIEPAGRYMVEISPKQEVTGENFQQGNITFKKPLVIDWGEGYQSGKNWKNVLSEMYGGRKGKDLSNAIKKDGYDGIITVEDGHTSEIVDLGGKEVSAEQLPQKNLVAVHNLSAANLIHAAELGGIAMPSLAILRKDLNFDNFGDITLLADKSLIDPANKTNVVGNADLYTPRYPSTGYVPNTKALSKFVQEARQIMQAKYGDEVTSLYRYSEDNVISEFKDRGPSELENNPLVMVKFMVDKGYPLPDKLDGISNYVRENHLQEFTTYAENLGERSTEKLRFFDGFTNSGTRRYKDYTLDNIVKKMKSEMKEGESFNYGAGTVRAKAAKKFTSIEKIRMDEGKLIPHAEMEAVKESFNNRLVELANASESHYKVQGRNFGYLDTFASALAEGIQTKNIERAFRENQFDTTNMDFTEIRQYVQELRDAPSEYFEAKVKRAVGLDEFKVAVIPSDTRQRVKDVLSKFGIQTVEYDPKVEGSRNQAVQKAATERDILFQNVKGAVTFDADGIKATIHAFESGDFSTLIHENGHVFRRMMADVAERTNNPYIKADLATIEDWTGAKDGVWDRAAEEKFARGFEKYITDGKAPTPALVKAFESFKNWMLEIYKTITGSAIDVKITDDVRRVFDRMLGAENLKIDMDAILLQMNYDPKVWYVSSLGIPKLKIELALEGADDAFAAIKEKANVMKASNEIYEQAKQAKTALQANLKSGEVKANTDPATQPKRTDMPAAGTGGYHGTRYAETSAPTIGDLNDLSQWTKDSMQQGQPLYQTGRNQTIKEHGGLTHAENYDNGKISSEEFNLKVGDVQINQVVTYFKSDIMKDITVTENGEVLPPTSDKHKAAILELQNAKTSMEEAGGGQEVQRQPQQFNADRNGQTDMFGLGEDMPLFSGSTMGAKLETYTPKVNETQTTMFDMRPEFGAKVKKNLEKIQANKPKAEGGVQTLFQAADPVDSPAFQNWFGDSKVVDEDGRPLVVYHGTNRDFTAFDGNAPRATDDGWYGKGFYFAPEPVQANAYVTEEGGNIMPVYLSLKNPFKYDSEFIKFNGKLLNLESFEVGDEIRNTVNGQAYKVEYKGSAAIHLKNLETGVTAYEDKGRGFVWINNNEPISVFEKTKSGGVITSAEAFTNNLTAAGYDGVFKTKNGKFDEIIAFYPEQVKSTANRGTFDPADPNILFQEADQPFGAYDAAAQFHPMSEVMEQGWQQQVGPLMDAMQEGAINQLRERPMDGAMRDTSPEANKMMRQYMNKVKGEMSSTKLATVRWGEKQRDFAMLNYNKRYGLDRAFESVVPYQFYTTRSVGTYAARIVDKPALFAHYARSKNQQERYERDIPERLRGKIKISAPWLPEWMGGGLYIDPSNLFFPAQLLKPIERAMQDKNYQTIETERILQEWSQDGQYSPQQIAEAAQSQSGTIWERANEEAKMRRESETANPIDFFTSFFGPAWYLSTPLNLAGIRVPGLSKGDPNKVSQLPLGNTARALDTVTQGTWAEPVGDIIGLLGKAEDWGRQKLNLPERGEYGEYYTKRQVANMVAEGLISPEEASLAMIEQQGKIWEEAAGRVDMELAMRVPGMSAAYAALHDGPAAGATAFIPSLFGAGLLPAGELEYRGLKQEWNEAWKKADAGDKTAVTEFFEEHPEYEAYLAKGKDGDELLKSFLIGQIWDGYMELGTTNQKQARNEMGDLFAQSFLDKETRSYDTLDIETLTLWARLLNKKTPVVSGQQAVGSGQQVQSQVGQQSPKLDLYSPSVTGITDQFFEERKKQFPNYYEQQQGYYALPKSERTAYLLKNPDLKKYWDWKDGWYDAYPQYQPIFNGQAFKTVDTSAWPPALEDYVTAYAYTGKKMPSGAYSALRQVWIMEGEPMGDFQVWVDSQVVPAMKYQSGDE